LHTDPKNWTHKQITLNGLGLHYVEAGPPDGPLVVLLHGFPEFWYGWRAQIPALAAAGYRVIVPDQRGYNLSDKPKGLDAYSLDALSGDVIALIDRLGQKQAYLAGHDWGAAVAWWTANKYPARIKRMVTMNVPHHRVMKQNLRSNPAQRRKSWYMFFFQLPWLPELLLGMRKHRLGTRILQSSSLPGTFSPEDMQHYRQAWSQPGAWRAMLNWYRATFRRPSQRLPSPRIQVPTLLIWGKQDLALGYEMAQPSIDLCEDGRLETLEHASHWVQHDDPQRVNQLLLDFFAEGT